MRLWGYVVAIPIVLLCGASTEAKDEKTANPSIEGVWIAQEYTVAGKRDSPEMLSFSITKSNISQRRGRATKEYSYDVDRSSTPMKLRMESTSTGTKLTLSAIFKLEKDILVICIAPPGEKPPGEFQSTETNNYILIKLRKEKD